MTDEPIDDMLTRAIVHAYRHALLYMYSSDEHKEITRRTDPRRTTAYWKERNDRQQEQRHAE